MLTPEGLRIIVESGRSVESFVKKAKDTPKKNNTTSLPEAGTVFEAKSPQPDTSFIEMLTQAELSL